MADLTTDDLRYPLGRFTTVPSSAARRAADIADIAALPHEIRAAVAGLDDRQLDTPYRPGGWTVRQLVHHVADSHMNGFVRVKLALTEDHPTIKPYDENAWALLADTRLPIELSLNLLDGLHRRWVEVYAGMSDADYGRTLKRGVDTFRAFVEAWYAGGFQKIIFHERHTPEIHRMISAILAGYVWDRNNPYVAETRRLAVLEELCSG